MYIYTSTLTRGLIPCARGADYKCCTQHTSVRRRRRRYEETTIIAWTDEHQNHVDMRLEIQIGLQEAAATAVGRPSF
jgi:hypothetical protein